MAFRLFDGPWIATEEHCKAHWGGGAKGEFFRCHLCGYKFKPGDKVRSQYTNDIPGASGNPLVCAECDTSPEDVIREWKKMNKMARNKYWIFTKEFFSY